MQTARSDHRQPSRQNNTVDAKEFQSGVCTWHLVPSALKENLKYYNHDVNREDLGPQNSAAVCSVP